MSFIYCAAIFSYFCIDAISIFKGCFNFSRFSKKSFVFRLFRFLFSTIGATHSSLYEAIIVLIILIYNRSAFNNKITS